LAIKNRVLPGKFSENWIALDADELDKAYTSVAGRNREQRPADAAAGFYHPRAIGAHSVLVQRRGQEQRIHVHPVAACGLAHANAAAKNGVFGDVETVHRSSCPFSATTHRA
jgi:hypothetical protein